ncbi:hypothetical protein [Curtobacterium sp. NPDC089991]
MRFVQAIGRGIGFGLSTVAKVLGTLNGGKPAGDDLAARLNQPRRDAYRP